ncbi:MAG: ATP-binding protein [Acidobacteria bacterium]|nr:ATP-binding protein [Acidobacteriota bacterium]MCU0254492.1 ATP-binding protein [Acidobacteriota bacterium]
MKTRPRVRLGALLVALNVLLLLIAVAAVTLVASRLMRQIARQEALSRVTWAGLAVQESIRDEIRSTADTAHLLADRPPLVRALEVGDKRGLAVFLEQFVRTGTVDAAAVLEGERIVAMSGESVPWRVFLADLPEGHGVFLRPRAKGGLLLLGGAALVPSRPGAVVMTASVLDERLAMRLQEKVGLTITILERDQVLAAGGGPRSSHRVSALSRAENLAVRDRRSNAYLAEIPLKSPAGAVVGLVEVSLPLETVDGPLLTLRRKLATWALGLSVLATLVGFFIARRISRPVLQLADAAERIGLGDLTTPVPRVGGAETSALAAALEEMRRDLLHLTTNLRRQQAESQAIVSGIAEGVFTVDRERRIRFLNPQAAAVLGLSQDAAIGRFCGDVLSPQGPGGVRPCEDNCPILHARFRGGARATEHLVLQDGRRRTVVITSSPTEEGIQAQVLRDETEVEAVRRVRDAVLANISHEFRTPLSAQLASIELLLDQIERLTPTQARELVLALQRGTLRLTHLIDNLLESVRIESGRGAIRGVPVDVAEIVADAVETLRPLLEQRRQRVALELGTVLPPVKGEKTRLVQVLVNLLANSNKFAPEGSTIAIRALGAPDAVTLWVEDEGPGLPADRGPELFGPFVRSMAGEEPEEHGFGLGLFIARSIVERHGGRIETRPAAVGQPAAVGITLPRASDGI